MGSWDYYCALCGSTFHGVHYVSQKPRTADREIPEHGQNQKDDGHTSDGQDSADEERCYDPDIVSSAEAAWSLNLRCIGFNPESPALGKAFISAIGKDDDYGGFEADPGDDPSAPDDLDTSYAAYGNPDGEIVYPFHSKCFDLFQQVISFKQGSQVNVELGFDGDWERKIPCLDVDKDLLYELFSERAGNFDRRLEMLYGEPEPPNEQFWEAAPGEEIFIADPVKQNDLAVKTIRNIWLSVSGRSTTSTAPAQNDPFVRLPVELLLIITSALDPSSLLNLLHASPHIHRGLGRNTSLWMQRLRDDMPWFYELHHFLYDLTSPAGCKAQGLDFNADTKYLPHDSLRHLFLWAHYTTTPRRGMKGPLIGIANRRRIWGICTQLADPYVARLPPSDFDVENEEETQFLNESVCLEMPVVTTPPPERFHTVRAFWVHTWSELNQRDRDFTLKLYWEQDNLIGLGTTMDDGKAPRLSLFGVEQQDTGQKSRLSVTEMRVDRGDWIAGFILYWPDTSEGYRKAGNANWVTAITVLCASGRKETFGEVYSRDIKRPVLPSKGMSIVGLTGHVGKTGKLSRNFRQFTRFGLLQVPSSDIKDHGRIDKANNPGDVVMPTWAERMAWTNDCTEIFTTGPSGRMSLDALPLPFTRTRSSSGIPIWDIPNLRIQQPITTISNHYHDDLIAYHPLIWARDAQEARSLRWLTGWVADGNIACGFTQDGKRWERFVPDICGIRAKFAPESTLEPRSIGMEEFVDEYQEFKWDENQCTHLDIDGAGGEMITAVAVTQKRCSPRAVKLVTDRGREVYWGEPNQPEDNWQTYTAPDGEMLIGIVSSFSKASGWDPEAKEPLRSGMSSIAVLSLPTK